MATCLDHNFTQCMTIIMFARTCISACVRACVCICACVHACIYFNIKTVFLPFHVYSDNCRVLKKKKADDGNMDVT